MESNEIQILQEIFKVSVVYLSVFCVFLDYFLLLPPTCVHKISVLSTPYIRENSRNGGDMCSSGRMVLWSVQLHNSKATGCLSASGGEIVANIPVLIQGQVYKRWQEIKMVFEILSNILDSNPSQLQSIKWHIETLTISTCRRFHWLYRCSLSISATHHLSPFWRTLQTSFLYVIYLK